MDTKNKKGQCALLVILISSPFVFSANILFLIPGGNVSHKTAMWPWVLELAKRGHNITYISPHEKVPKAHPNITDFASKTLSEVVSSVYQVDRFKDRHNGKEKDFNYNKIVADTCKLIVDNRNSDPVFKQLFTNSSFDLVIVNGVFGECSYYVGQYFGAKAILYTPCTLITWHYDVFGVLPETAWIPDLIFTSKNIPMTFMDRAYGVMYEFIWSLEREKLSSKLQKAFEPLLGVGNTPSLYELENKVSIALINSHPSMDFAKSLGPLFVDVGGMAVSSSSGAEKEMPKNFKDFMDNAGSGGVILITFGSTVLLNTVSTRYQAMFFHLINEFPNVRFLMRWSGPMPRFVDAIPNNLLVSEWLPQTQILSHPNLRLFITHGGISSIQEATYYGVPMIVIPLFADQDYNAYRIEAQEVGLRVEIREMTEDSLVRVVDKVLKNDKYKKNMMKKSALFRDRPLTPVDTAVYWTEFALRHDDTMSTLRPANTHLNTFQRKLIDVYAFFAGVILSVIFFLFYLGRLLLKIVFHKNTSTPTKKMKRK